VDRRTVVHAALARAARDPVDAVRHRAMTSDRADADIADSLVAAAESARRRGALGLVAELYLLAAERTPPQCDEQRSAALVAAAEAAAAAGQPEVAGRAVEAVLGSPAPPAHRVRARLALVDASGQALAELDEVLAAALVDAAGDPALLAPLRLRLAWQALVGGLLQRAAQQAREAVRYARQVGDASTEAMALAVRAQVERLTGVPGYAATLARARALPAVPPAGWLHLTPAYLSVRLAILDDRLDEARADLLGMLAGAQRGTAGEELVEVLRSLAEVAARAGRCREALHYAARALRAGQVGRSSPGPYWYTAAVAELAGGSLWRATAYARRGVRVSREEGDTIYLRRNLHALGQAILRGGDARGAVEVLGELRASDLAQGVADPSGLRWHADLAAGLVSLGAHTEAAEVIADARREALRLGGAPGVLGQLDRAAAVVLTEQGDAGAAVELSAAAADRFAALRQPIEEGHCLLVQGAAERRRRRYAAARLTIGAALTIFAQAEARPWVEQTARLLAPEGDGGSTAPSAHSTAGGTLTSTEARIAALVRRGESNREIAARLFLSVKTVEASLTRIYRKLGVRSRTQLSSRLDAALDMPLGVAARVFPDSSAVTDL
jgi:DNA-binding NarL/FixJ family response regulator